MINGVHPRYRFNSGASCSESVNEKIADGFGLLNLVSGC